MVATNNVVEAGGADIAEGEETAASTRAALAARMDKARVDRSCNQRPLPEAA
jgi:hypothetical protein